MTPPPATSHVAQPTPLSSPSGSFGRDLTGMVTAQFVEPGMWARTRFLVDLLMLTLAASAAVFAAPDLHTGPNRLLAAVFPLLAVVTLRARRDRGEWLRASILDTGTAVIAGVSSAAILTLALATVV